MSQVLAVTTPLMDVTSTILNEQNVTFNRQAKISLGSHDAEKISL
jgi:hypothetical protein